jgi:hypothetical protein
MSIFLYVAKKIDIYFYCKILVKLWKIRLKNLINKAMKRTIDYDNNISNINLKNNDFSYCKKQKTFPQQFNVGSVILVNDLHYMDYNIESERNIFVHHYAKIKCVFCENKIHEYIGSGYDKDPEDIDFVPIKMQNHLKNFHSDKFICIDKIFVDKKKQLCELVITKKIIL